MCGVVRARLAGRVSSGTAARKNPGRGGRRVRPFSTGLRRGVSSALIIGGGPAAARPSRATNWMLHRVMPSRAGARRLAASGWRRCSRRCRYWPRRSAPRGLTPGFCAAPFPTEWTPNCTVVPPTPAETGRYGLPVFHAGLVAKCSSARSTGADQGRQSKSGLHELAMIDLPGRADPAVQGCRWR